MAVGMGHEKYRLLRMVDIPIRQTWLIVVDQRDAILSGDISCGHDHKLVPVNPRTKAYFLDSAAGNLAANSGAIEHVGQHHVIYVARFSGDFVESFLARNGRADDLITVHDS